MVGKSQNTEFSWWVFLVSGNKHNECSITKQSNKTRGILFKVAQTLAETNGV